MDVPIGHQMTPGESQKAKIIYFCGGGGGNKQTYQRVPCGGPGCRGRPPCGREAGSPGALGRRRGRGATPHGPATHRCKYTVLCTRLALQAGMVMFCHDVCCTESPGAVLAPLYMALCYVTWYCDVWWRCFVVLRSCLFSATWCCWCEVAGMPRSIVVS